MNIVIGMVTIAVILKQTNNIAIFVIAPTRLPWVQPRNDGLVVQGDPKQVQLPFYQCWQQQLTIVMMTLITPRLVMATVMIGWTLLNAIMMVETVVETMSHMGIVQHVSVLILPKVMRIPVFKNNILQYIWMFIENLIVTPVE